MNGELTIALLLGLIGGVIPGPVITAIFTEILQSGLGRSLRIVFTALVTETLVALISLVLFSAMGLPESFFRGLSFAGAVLLVWIALTLWKVKAIGQDASVRFGTWKLIAMILTNGVLWTYWITICIPRAMLLGDEVRGGAYLFMGGVQLGWLLSTLLLAFLFSRFRPLLSRPRVVPVVFKVFSLAFIYFAADMVYRSLTYFLS